jgi:HPr kinase/phosphorylase
MPKLDGYQHGVMLRVATLGVLVTGAPGAGKSELGLALLARGHVLIADDLVAFERQGKELIASAPVGLGNYLMAGELGVVDVLATFGRQAKADRQRLNLIVHLSDEDRQVTEMDPISGTWETREILDCSVPYVRFSRSRAYQLPVLVECACRQLELRASGKDPVKAFRELQRKLSRVSV